MDWATYIINPIVASRRCKQVPYMHLIRPLLANRNFYFYPSTWVLMGKIKWSSILIMFGTGTLLAKKFFICLAVIIYWVWQFLCRQVYMWLMALEMAIVLFTFLCVWNMNWALMAKERHLCMSYCSLIKYEHKKSYLINELYGSLT